MKELQDQIIKDGVISSDGVLRIGSFLNHQIDPQLMNWIGFTNYFKIKFVNGVIMVKSSGIAPAVMTGFHLNVPIVFTCNNKSVTLNDDLYASDVYSFTKKVINRISISKQFVKLVENYWMKRARMFIH